MQIIKAIISLRFIFPSVVLGSFTGELLEEVTKSFTRTLHFHSDLLWLSQTTSESIWANEVE